MFVLWLYPWSFLCFWSLLATSARSSIALLIPACWDILLINCYYYRSYVEFLLLEELIRFLPEYRDFCPQDFWSFCWADLFTLGFYEMLLCWKMWFYLCLFCVNISSWFIIFLSLVIPGVMKKFFIFAFTCSPFPDILFKLLSTEYFDIFPWDPITYWKFALLTWFFSFTYY